MARAYRPRRQTTTPLQAMRALVEEELTDDANRPPARTSWEALSPQEQTQTVALALDPVAGTEAWQAWIVGAPHADPLLGAVCDVLLGSGQDVAS